MQRYRFWMAGPLFPFLFLFFYACAYQSEPPLEPVAIDAQLTKAPLASAEGKLQTIAFGSCNNQNLPQPLWRKLIQEKPELFIWTGDVVYADTASVGVLSHVYLQQLQQPEYQSFLSSAVPVIGVYDDHDYGENNGGSSYPQKVASQKLFLDFIGEPQDSPRRQREGIYTSYRFGPEGQRVKVVLLDTRYHRSTPGAKGDMLGSSQWSWLQQELQKNDAEVLLLVSSIQILPFEHRFEKWADFPASRQRLLDLLDKTPVPNLLIISGDRHFAEFSQVALPSGRRLLEVTASGLTHSYTKFDEQKNQNGLRLGPVLNRLNYGWLELNWEAKTMTVQVKDINREAIMNQVVPLKT